MIIKLGQSKWPGSEQPDPLFRLQLTRPNRRLRQHLACWGHNHTGNSDDYTDSTTVVSGRTGDRGQLSGKSKGSGDCGKQVLLCVWDKNNHAQSHVTAGCSVVGGAAAVTT